MSKSKQDIPQHRQTSSPVSVGIVFAAFPAKDPTPYKYFLLLLNRLQNSCEFEFLDIEENDEFAEFLAKGPIDQNEAVRRLEAFEKRLRHEITASMRDHDLSLEQPDQIIVVTGATLSDNHYLTGSGGTTLITLGLWEKFMAPPSLAEFLQLLVLSAPYMDGSVRNATHLGTRGCVFDFTELLADARLAALTGVGVCSKCALALARNGFPNAAQEIRLIATGEWRGDRTTPGTPANIMDRLGYPLFLTKGFELSWRERLPHLFTIEICKEVIKFIFAVLIAYIAFIKRWKN